METETDSGNDDYDIVDVENYKSSYGQVYSLQTLVMKAMSKCIEAGGKEMRTGYWNIKSDKFGNQNKVYIPDARMEFIESINTLLMLVESQADKNAEEDLKKIEADIDEEYKKLCKLEKEEWGKLHHSIRKERILRGIFYIPDSLNTNLSYYKEFVEFKVNQYRKIFSTIQKLILRKHLFEEEVVTIMDKGN
jgi:hypothetical protein